jgi:CheY-like chemotaxis protein
MDCRMIPESNRTPGATNQQVQLRDAIRCVVVLEDRDAVRERIEELLKNDHWIAIAVKDWRECSQWAQKLVRYFILDIVLFENRTAGFEALEAIKNIAPDAYCAVVTEDMARVRGIAKNLHADHICSKSDEDLKNLLQQLEKLSPELSERERALQARADIQERSEEIGKLLVKDMIVQAERELVTLEPPLARAFALTTLGDEFGTVIDALRLALVNQPGRSLTIEQWRVWLDVMERAFSPDTLEPESAYALADKLEAAGWITEPPQFGIMAEFLLGGEEGTDDHH